MMDVLKSFLMIGNNETTSLKTIPQLPFMKFRLAIIDAIKSGARLSAMPAYKTDEIGSITVIAVLSFPATAELGLLAAPLTDNWTSLTPDCPAAHWFERELAEKWHIQPKGHPWLKPIRFEHPCLVSGDDIQDTPIGKTQFFQMSGSESHEVAVGPVHAGVIEPGHFRFLCHGETVYHLEISLGYQHRGVERAMISGPDLRSMHYMETLSGDSTIGHSTAYCHVIEALAGITAPARCEAIRAIAAELERIANHIGDLGAMAGDVGFLPTLNYCGRIRGDVLNLTAVICGNRFGRGLNRPAGVQWDLDSEMVDILLTRLESVEKDVNGAVSLMFETPSLQARFEGTGSISAETSKRIGLVGIAARACGLEQDIRFEFPYGIYNLRQVPVRTWPNGDCFARAYVRWLEITASISFIRLLLKELPAGSVKINLPTLPPETLAVSLVEGWRGEICHTAATDNDGHFKFYKVVDPSFHNWFGLALALRGQQISDFPLCNKSFNLSYCGHDL